ncbi:MAG: hypothetical protein ACN6RE_09150 [Stenotrophomonas sepilia]
MAQQVIDTTTDHGSYKGDPAKVAFEKANANFSELYPLVSSGGKNLLINCGVPINQRGFAGGSLAAGAYGYDRWKAGAGGCNVSINATTGVFTHTSGAIQQIVEAPQQAWGQALTFSVESPTGTLSVSVGGATGTITAGSGRRSVTVTPAGSGHMTVQITASGATYSRPQLERGSSATAFDVRPWAVEFALCQRYYEKSYNSNMAPGTADRTGSYRCGILNGFFLSAGSIPFAVQKRGAPAIAVYAARDGTVGNGSEVNNQGVFIANRALSTSFAGNSQFQVGGTNTLTAGSLIEFHWTADAEL